MARSIPGKRGTAPVVFGLIAGACLAAIGALGATTFWSVYSTPSETVSAGVSVADVEVGGMAREEARDGFEAVVARTVSLGGRVIDELRLESRYAPSRNVVLVGTRR
jgi:hypothetical protein